MNSTEAQKAYQAGKTLPDVQWPDDLELPPEKRVLGVHHCPFAEGDPQREMWLKGLRDRLEEPAADPKKVLAEIKKELA